MTYTKEEQVNDARQEYDDSLHTLEVASEDLKESARWVRVCVKRVSENKIRLKALEAEYAH